MCFFISTPESKTAVLFDDALTLAALTLAQPSQSVSGRMASVLYVKNNSRDRSRLGPADSLPFPSRCGWLDLQRAQVLLWNMWYFQAE